MDIGYHSFGFMKGYTNTRNQKYMNLGLGISPYPGKVGHGDYGPPQGGGLYYIPNHCSYDAGTFQTYPLGTEQMQPDTSLNVCTPLSTPSSARNKYRVRVTPLKMVGVPVKPSTKEQCSSCE